ncbi:MAG TPA: isochorismatase family protein [Acidimicrobiia bacterium]|nr:isochorismatase family protein [Acidimicrobiia bacterium]
MISYDSSTALVVVDVQNDFADPSGSLFVQGGDAVVPRVNIEVMRALSAGAFVVYTQDWHPESTPHFEKDGGIWPVHCVQGTWGAEFHPGLEVSGPIVQNGANGEDGYSGFTMRDPVTGEETPTALRGMLEERGCQRVVVVGLALDWCVKETALDAAKDYETSVIPDASASVDLEPGDGQRAIEEMRNHGVIIG